MICGGLLSPITPGSTSFFSLFHSGGAYGYGPLNYLNAPKPGNASRLILLADQPPGVGETLKLTFNINTVGTPLTVTLTGAVDIQVSNLITVVPFNFADGINFSFDNSAGSACTYFTCGLLISL